MAANEEVRVKKQKEKQTMSEKLNTLRAGVLGSNDGILTVVGVLFSVAAATNNQFTIFIAGLSDLLACAFEGFGGIRLRQHAEGYEKSAVRRKRRC